MIYETISLWDKHPEATLTSYCITSTAELKLDPRRAVVVCPGGGYHFLSDREAEPIVFKFLSAGFNVFLLRYKVVRTEADMGLGYEPVTEAARAIAHVRENAEKYNIDPEKIFVVAVVPDRGVGHNNVHTLVPPQLPAQLADALLHFLFCILVVTGMIPAATTQA